MGDDGNVLGTPTGKPTKHCNRAGVFGAGFKDLEASFSANGGECGRDGCGQLAFHADGKRSFLSGSCPDSLLILSRIDSVTPSTTFTENGGTFEDFEVRKGPAGVFHHFCRIVIPHRNYP